MTTGAPPLQHLKQMAKATWMAGDFGEIARYNQEAGIAFVERLGLTPGAKVLDVGCGTGNQSLPAARKGAHVTAVDIAPNLLTQAAQRARAEKLDIEFREGDAEALPFGDDEFDVVMSAFAAIFAPRPEKVALEFLRVCRHPGLIAMANIKPSSFIAAQFVVMARYAPPPKGFLPPVLWGDEAVVRQRFGPSVQIETTTQIMRMDLPFGVAEAVAHSRKHLGPIHMAFAGLDKEKQKGLEADLLTLWSQYNKGDEHHTIVENEYLEVHVRSQ